MNNANSKTCAYLLKNPSTCQINLHLFFRRGTQSASPRFCLPSADSRLLPVATSDLPFSPRILIRAARWKPGNRAVADFSHTKKTQTIDPKTGDSFKSYSVTESISATAPGWSQPGRPAGAGDPAWDLQPSVPPLSRHMFGQ